LGGDVRSFMRVAVDVDRIEGFWIVLLPGLRLSEEMRASGRAVTVDEVQPGAQLARAPMRALGRDVLHRRWRAECSSHGEVGRLAPDLGGGGEKVPQQCPGRGGG